MLSGKVIYKVNENTRYVYEVTGFDSSVLSLNMVGLGAAKRFMCSADMDSNDFFDGEDDQSRRVDIKLVKIAVQTGKHNENGKMVKNPVNDLLFCQLAAVIRYVKGHCIKKNEKYYTGITLASKEFEAITDTEYVIPFPNKKDETLATVTLHLGCIYELHVDAPTLKIDLTNDATIEDYLPKLTDAWQSGIKFDADYLGFEPEQMETVDNLDTVNGMYTCIEDVIKAHPDKEFSWLLGKDYRIVDDEHLDEICKYIMDWDGYVYYDTETTGLNINFKSRVGQADQLVGVVLSVKYGESFFFPVQMKSIKNLCNGDHWYFMEHYMRPILEGKQLVAHNMSYDWKVAYIYDINANIVHDTMALIKLTIGAEVKDYPMGLKENAQTLLGRNSLELSDLLKDDEWGESEIKFWDLPYELVRLYACADTDNTNGLLQYALQSDLLTKYNAKKVYEIEIAFSFAVSYQEFFGHRIDVSNLAVVRKAIGEEQENYMKQMVDIVGHEFNPNSSPQLQKILYQELGVPEQISRKTGRPTTDKETLKKLAEITDENDEPKYPFCGILQKYREAEGVRKIVDKFPEHVTPDGYVFSHVMQYGTTTGRVSINTPNYQSYNDPIKKNVVPRPGFWMFDTDYSSVEYRVLGNMVGNKRIMESFKDPDFDYHQYQAARMYGVPYATVTKKMRKSAKGINFGLPYGMGDESLGVRIYGESTPENTKKAAALRAAYFKGQEDIRDWFEYHRNRGVNEGFTETYFGRRRYYHKGEFSVGAIRRQAGNQVIQGCLHGDTKIETKEFGIKPIRELVGYSGLVWNGTDWTHGDILYSGKKQKCIITFDNGQKFICSPIHKFLKIGGDATNIEDYIECKDLKPYYAVTCNMCSSLKVDWFDEFVSPSIQEIEYEDEDGNNVHELVEVDDKDRCAYLRVESVEITDEYIDMYDVCNTDCGYYVADGIITHNTAADIYKTAVGRVFKRICREGWLGKVLFTGFIHDELLGEVSNEINPGIFLKMLREEFEVKITNDDGTPWCPLYMGFGYGMSWYEAKSVELPIKLQWEIVEKYGETGFPNWTGNGRAFCDTVPDMLRDFSVRDIRNQLLDANSQGKEIKPTLNNELIDCVKEDAQGYAEGLKACCVNIDTTNQAIVNATLAANEQPIVDYLDKVYHIQSLMKDDDGNYVLEYKPSKKTQECIDLFCKVHATDRSKVNLLDIAEVSATVNTDDVAIEQDEESNVQTEFMLARIAMLGQYCDINQGLLYIRYLRNPALWSKVCEYFMAAPVEHEKCYQMVMVETDYNNRMTPANCYITSANVPKLSDLYLQMMKMGLI